MFAAAGRISEKSVLREGEVRKGKEGKSCVCGALPPEREETKRSATVTEVVAGRLRAPEQQLREATASFPQCLMCNAHTHQVYRGVRGQRVREEENCPRERFTPENLMFLCQVDINIT